MGFEEARNDYEYREAETNNKVVDQAKKQAYQ